MTCRSASYGSPVCFHDSVICNLQTKPVGCPGCNCALPAQPSARWKGEYERQPTKISSTSIEWAISEMETDFAPPITSWSLSKLPKGFMLPRLLLLVVRPKCIQRLETSLKGQSFKPFTTHSLPKAIFIMLFLSNYSFQNLGFTRSY